MLKQLFGKVIGLIQYLFGRKQKQRKTKSYPANSGGFVAMNDRAVIEEQRVEIDRLKRKLAAEEGQFTMVGEERKYVIDDDQQRFNELKHRNLGGVVLQNLLSAGLHFSKRTVDNDPNGDLQFSEDGSDEDNKLMDEIFDKLEAKYGALSKAKGRKENGK